MSATIVKAFAEDSQWALIRSPERQAAARDLLVAAGGELIAEVPEEIELDGHGDGMAADHCADGFDQLVEDDVMDGGALDEIAAGMGI